MLCAGNQLPGTTADFQNMMQMLVRQGIPAENILGGVGKATAYLAVQLKKTPEAAAEFAAKMQDATGNGVRRHDGAVRHYPEGVLSGR
ncbi:bacteriophage V tail protein [Escherichia coli]|uniref:Bacteriophage V tail protein n=1 Tax=Escherichia coli TaxID=562 RepID=A0A2X1Q4F0_ECOLX|nr:bacteriophage V tail protein [Escherichia coli]